MPTPPLTKQDLAGLEKRIGAALERQTATLTSSIRGLNLNVTQTLASMDHHVGRVEAKVDAVIEMLATRKEVRNLVRELKAQGIELDENKIFA